MHIFINGFKYGVKIAPDAEKLAFRYVSFGANNFNYDNQEFFYDCEVHHPDTVNMDTWTDVEYTSIYA